MTEVERAVLALGWAALELDQVVREYRWSRRQQGLPEDYLQQGLSSAEHRLAALRKVDEAFIAARRVLREAAT